MTTAVAGALITRTYQKKKKTKLSQTKQTNKQQKPIRPLLGDKWKVWGLEARVRLQKSSSMLDWRVRGPKALSLITKMQPTFRSHALTAPPAQERRAWNLME